MRSLKLGSFGLLIVLTGVALLWVTNAMPQEDLTDVATKAVGAVVVLVLASLAWSVLRGEKSATTDSTDKPAP
jgi:hypothetical protein